MPLVRLPILFLFIYSPKIIAFPVNMGKIMIFIVVISALFKKIRVDKQTFELLKISCLIIMVTLIIMLILLYGHGSSDYKLIYNIVIFYTESYLGSLLIVLIFYSYRPKEILFWDLVVIGALQSLIILAMLTNSSIRDSIFYITGNQGFALFERYGGFRGLGISASVAYDLSTSLVLSQVFLLYLYLDNTKKIKYVKFVLIWLIIFLAIMITGRTGIIFSLLSLIALLNNARGFSAIAGLFLCILMLSSFGVSYVGEVDSKGILDRVSRYSVYLSEVISDGVNTRSVVLFRDSLSAFDLNSFLFGVGKFEFALGDRYYTDSGYIRHINYVGFLGVVGILYFYLYNYLSAVGCIKNQKVKLYILLNVVYLYLFLWHIKGDILIGSGLNIKFLFLIIFYFVNSGAKNDNNKVFRYE